MNIIQTIQDLLSSQLLSQISNSVGESSDATKSALAQSVPALLGSAAAQASSPQGATSLFNFLREKTPQGGWMASAASLLGNFTGESSSAGSSFVSTLLGPKVNMLRDFIASRAGIRSESASGLLGTAGHLLMNILGKQVAAQGLGAAGFGELLRSQIPHLQGLVPPALSGMLGLGNLLGSDKTAARASTTPPQAVYEPAEPPELSSSTRVLRRALVPLALALAAIFLVYRFYHSSNTGGTTDSSLTMRDEGGANSPPPSLSQVSLANLTEQLKTAIARHDGNPVDLQGVGYDSSGNLSPDASDTVSLLGRMLNKTTSMKVTITVYGKTSEEASARANTFRTALAKTGDAGERVAIQTEIGEALPKISFYQ